MNILPLVLLWIVPIFVLLVGLIFACLQGRWPTRVEQDYRLDAMLAFASSAITSWTGPIAIIGAFICFSQFRYGFLWPSWKRLFP